MAAITEKSKKTNLKKNSPHAPTMEQVAAIILGGGQGTRLYPLTLTRSKPSICFGGNYRIIDVAVSNAINSGCSKVHIITQFFSTTLHEHLYSTYTNDSFSTGRVQLLTAEERPSKRGWFSGTADAVRQNLEYLSESSADYFLILSGDQLYNINFDEMLRVAHEKDADLTIASILVKEEETKRLGILKLNNDHQIVDFIEKPQSQSLLEPFRVPDKTRKKLGSTERPYLASMGIYLFKRQALIDLLINDEREDFGKHLIPKKVKEGSVFSYIYDGYWEDIGTIESFHHANIAFTQSNPPFNTYDEKWPLYCKHQNLPAPKITRTTLNHAIICEGSVVEADEISRSIIGPRSRIKAGCIIRETYIMGNNFYTPPKYSPLPQDLSVGENTIIFKAIVDKHASIGNNVQLINKQGLNHYDSDNLYVRDGVIVVPRGAVIPNGFIF